MPKWSGGKPSGPGPAIGPGPPRGPPYIGGLPTPPLKSQRVELNICHKIIAFTDKS